LDLKAVYYYSDVGCFQGKLLSNRRRGMRPHPKHVPEDGVQDVKDTDENPGYNQNDHDNNEKNDYYP